MYKMLKKISMLLEIKKYEYYNNVEWNVGIFTKYKIVEDIYLYIKKLT